MPHISSIIFEVQMIEQRLYEVSNKIIYPNMSSLSPTSDVYCIIDSVAKTECRVGLTTTLRTLCVLSRSTELLPASRT